MVLINDDLKIMFMISKDIYLALNSYLRVQHFLKEDTAEGESQVEPEMAL